MSRVQQSKNIVQWKDLSISMFFRCTFPCLLIPCTCERTALVTSVASVERSSQDRGCWKDTCGRTPEKSRTGVPSVKNPSPTSQTWELTFRLTRLQKWEHDSLFYSQTPSVAFQLQQMWKRICTQVLSGETRRGGMRQLNNWGFGNVFVRRRRQFVRRRQLQPGKTSSPPLFADIANIGMYKPTIWVYQWCLLSWWSRTWFVKYLCFK